MKRIVVSLLFATLPAGCYTLQPAGGTLPPVGKEVAFDVNDAGRLALGGSMGAEVSQIEGRLVEHDTGQYVVAVSAVHFLRGGEQPWTGESVRIKPEYVGSSYQRTFSPSRTIALSAVGVLAMAALAKSPLLGSGNGQQSTITPDSGKTQRYPGRLWIPLLSLRPERIGARLLSIIGRP